jgi:large subunit ribosomal protein L30
MTKLVKYKLTLKHSTAGRNPRHCLTVRGLGLRHRHHSSEVIATPAVMGMIKQVAYLLQIEELK